MYVFIMLVFVIGRQRNIGFLNGKIHFEPVIQQSHSLNIPQTDTSKIISIELILDFRNYLNILEMGTINFNLQEHLLNIFLHFIFFKGTEIP